VGLVVGPGKGEVGRGSANRGRKRGFGVEPDESSEAECGEDDLVHNGNDVGEGDLISGEWKNSADVIYT
jgi:hypothetical protein